MGLSLRTLMVTLTKVASSAAQPCLHPARLSLLLRLNRWFVGSHLRWLTQCAKGSIIIGVSLVLVPMPAAESRLGAAAATPLRHPHPLDAELDPEKSKWLAGQRDRNLPLLAACGLPGEVVSDSNALSSSSQPAAASLKDLLLPILTTALSTRPFPQIQPQAQLARVPVIMYHDILPQKQVFFDVTPAEFEAELKLIQAQGATPISWNQLVNHLATGMPLPKKPILLTFDDGYEGHYKYVYPLLKQYGYPAVFGIYTAKVGRKLGRSSISWEQLREMAADPLITIAAHTITHPDDLTDLPDHELRQEIVESKRILEAQLGTSIDHFMYPAGHYDDRVKRWVKLAGYKSAMTMDDNVLQFAGESNSLLEIARMGQYQLDGANSLKHILEQADGGVPLLALGQQFNFNTPIRLRYVANDKSPLALISGGKPITIHADSRYEIAEFVNKGPAVAAVDGTFFSLKELDSNVMVGPVFSQSTGRFIPGNGYDVSRSEGRPLVIISPNAVEFVPFDRDRHNTLSGIKALQPKVTDAFVAGAWLVRDSQPQSKETFSDLFGFDSARHRAFWGIDQAGQAVVGISMDNIDAIDLGELLANLGFRDAVMLDSGGSTSLAYQGKSLTPYSARPVPHAVALVPAPEPAPKTAQAPDCINIASAPASDPLYFDRPK